MKRPPQVTSYDLVMDSWELNNLAGDPQCTSIREALRRELEQWMK